MNVLTKIIFIYLNDSKNLIYNTIFKNAKIFYLFSHLNSKPKNNKIKETKKRIEKNNIVHKLIRNKAN